MSEMYDRIRAAFDAAGLDVQASVLDRAAAVVVAEIEIGSRAPAMATISGADWVTLKALNDASSETVGSLKRGAQFLVGRPEGPWRPVYGEPVGWISANLVDLT